METSIHDGHAYVIHSYLILKTILLWVEKAVLIIPLMSLSGRPELSGVMSNQDYKQTVKKEKSIALLYRHTWVLKPELYTLFLFGPS